MKRIWMNIAVMAAAILTLPRSLWPQEAPASGGSDISGDRQAIAAQRADIIADVADKKTDSQAVSQDRAAVRADVQAYNGAVSQYGAGSVQAKTAFDALVSARVALHTELGDLEQVRQDLDKAAIAQMRAAIDKDVVELDTDSKAVAEERGKVRQARDAYNNAVIQYGPNSPQAQAAQTNLDQAQIALHGELGDMKTLEAGISKDRAELAKDDQKLAHEDIVLDERQMAELKLQLDKDAIDQKTDSLEAAKDRAFVRSARDDYRKAVEKYGQDSPQAKAAEAAEDHAQLALHRELGDLRFLAEQESRDRKDWTRGHDILRDERAMAKLRDDIKNDVADVRSDSKEVKQDRSAVRDARKDYLKAVKKYGKDSWQAKAAEADLDHAQIVLHEQLGDLKADVKDIAQDRARLDHDRMALRRDLGFDHDHDRDYANRDNRHPEPPMRTQTR